MNASPVSAFMASHLPDFFGQYGIDFTIDGPQLEYFVFNKKTGHDVSCSLTVNFDENAGIINVMTFYPGLFLHAGTRYFSAACFFIVMQHFAHFHHIKCQCHICLNTKESTFQSFYSHLQDFDFHLESTSTNDRVDLESVFEALNIDTSMICERPLAYDS